LAAEFLLGVVSSESIGSDSLCRGNFALDSTPWVCACFIVPSNLPPIIGMNPARWQVFIAEVGSFLVVAEREQVHVLIIRQGDHWIAQCLEYDIGAQAINLDQLRAVLLETIEAEHEESLRRHKKAFAGIDPAPKYFYERWNQRSTTLTPTFPVVASEASNVELEFGLDA
jgi:hypothetical protein